MTMTRITALANADVPGATDRLSAGVPQVADPEYEGFAAHDLAAIAAAGLATTLVVAPAPEQLAKPLTPSRGRGYSGRHGASRPIRRVAVSSFRFLTSEVAPPPAEE